jgi:subtilisin family serine protease
VGIIDAPVDLSHEQLKDAVDMSFLASIPATDEDGRKTQALQLTQTAFTSKMAASTITDRVAAVRAVEAMQILGDPACYPAGSETKLKQTALAANQNDVKSLGDQIHGTHVASLMVQGLREPKLVPFPFLSFSKERMDRMRKEIQARNDRSTGSRLSIRERILKPQLDEFRTQLRLDFSRADELIKNANLRVVNLSIGLNAKEMFDDTPLLLKGIFWNPIKRRNYLKEFFQDMGTAFKQEMSWLAQSNPDVAFVIASGNDGASLDEGLARGNTGTLDLPNVVMVASLGPKQNLSPFTNYSAQYVDVGARGSCVKGALAGGGTIILSGTSMASPTAANALAKVMESNPDLSAEQAIRFLLDEVAVKVDAYTSLIKNGKILK